MWQPLLIKFDKQSKQLRKQSWIIPINCAPDEVDVLPIVYKWLAKPYIQEWFKDCRVVWIETIGEVNMYVDDFV